MLANTERICCPKHKGCIWQLLQQRASLAGQEHAFFFNKSSISYPEQTLIQGPTVSHSFSCLHIWVVTSLRRNPTPPPPTPPGCRCQHLTSSSTTWMAPGGWRAPGKALRPQPRGLHRTQPGSRAWEWSPASTTALPLQIPKKSRIQRGLRKQAETKDAHFKDGFPHCNSSDKKYWY